MNPSNGAIYAMASGPTYSPMVHVPPYKGSGAVFKSKLTPAYDKAFQGTYPAGSTFKPITATAAYESGVLAPGQRLDCPGQYISRNDIAKQKTIFHDWTPLSMGSMDLSKALEVSCDTFFYQLGDKFWGRNNQFQSWIRQLGYGTAPPLDAGGAQAGRRARSPCGRPRRTGPARRRSRRSSRRWLPGRRHQHVDRPGQPARLAAAAGRRLQRPRERRRRRHPARRRGHPPARQHDPGRSPGGEIDPRPVRRLNLSPTLLAEIKLGLYGATHAGDGTSTATFGHFSPTVYGKTGTAEVPTTTCPNCADAWWAGWASQGNRSLVVVAFIHNGGHGGVSAAPVAASVFQAFFAPQRQLRAPRRAGPVAMTPLPAPPRLPDAGDRALDLGLRPVDHADGHAPLRRATSTATSCCTSSSARSACSSSRRCRRRSCAALRWPLYGFVLLSTAAVLAVGTSIGGGRRWINLGAFQFQPSEFAKLLLIVGLAAVLASRRGVTGPARLTLLAILYVLPAGDARVQGARLRHDARLPGDHARDAVRLRHPLAALRVDGDRRRGDRRARVLDPAGDGRAGGARATRSRA